VMRFALYFIFGAILLTAAQTRSVAQTTSLRCSGTQQPKQVAELIFGRDIGKRLGVSESAFARFVAREMTPRFPDGLTITDAVGQWRDPKSDSIVREPSKRVEIVLAGNDSDKARLDAVVEAYKREFRQQAVVVIVRGACVSF
jgi:hypothetical protein